MKLLNARSIGRRSPNTKEAIRRTGYKHIRIKQRSQRCYPRTPMCIANNANRLFTLSRPIVDRAIIPAGYEILVTKQRDAIDTSMVPSE